MNLPIAVDELGQETADAVFDHAGHRIYKERDRRGRRPSIVVGSVVGSWTLVKDLGIRTFRDGTRQARGLFRHNCASPEIREYDTGRRDLPARCDGCREAWLAARREQLATIRAARPVVAPVEGELTREQRRSRRRREVRGRTLKNRNLKTELRIGAAVYPDAGERELRPVVRGECQGGGPALPVRLVPVPSLPRRFARHRRHKAEFSRFGARPNG